MDLLLEPLSKMFGKPITGTSSESTQLHGGTVGDVKLYEGMAAIADGQQLPFKIVCKTQKQWERYGDPDSWRREYDLYKSDLGSMFTDALHWPKLYHDEFNDNEYKLWMEYIDGASADELTCDMLEQASLELGRFQGRIYAEKPAFLEQITNLSIVDAMKNFYHHYRSWDVVYNYVRSEDCEIPKHLCQMIINGDETSDEVHSHIEKLPVVFCHRDFWVTNIFYTDAGIRLIDWDTTGWGYLGEDMVSLIADEADVDHMIEYYQRCIPAYLKGFSEYVDISHIENPYIHERMILHYGYRLIEWYLDAESPDEKAYHLATLQKIHEIAHVLY